MLSFSSVWIERYNVGTEQKLCGQSQKIWGQYKNDIKIEDINIRRLFSKVQQHHEHHNVISVPRVYIIDIYPFRESQDKN